MYTGHNSTSTTLRLHFDKVTLYTGNNSSLTMVSIKFTLCSHQQEDKFFSPSLNVDNVNVNVNPPFLPQTIHIFD